MKNSVIFLFIEETSRGTQWLYIHQQEDVILYFFLCHLMAAYLEYTHYGDHIIFH